MRMHRLAEIGRVLACGAALVAGLPTVAQDDGAPAALKLDYSPVWSDAEFARIAGMLSGSWRTVSAVAQTGDEGTVEVVMTIAPIGLSGVPDALYAELARADALHRPYRRAIFQLYRYGDGVRLRTLEFRNPEHDTLGLLTGLWLVPGMFPDVPRDSLIATLDVELTRDGDGYKGRTPYPYPTATGGAVEMTSEIEISSGRLVTADRGYDASRRVVWGSGEDARYVYERFDHPFRVEDRDGGIKVIIMRQSDEGPALRDNDQVVLHYSGWLTDGTMFDSSLRPGGRALTYQAPGQLIPGWRNATYGMRLGDARKFILPPDQAYGESGAGGGRIPPHATLVFEVECMFLRRPEETPHPEGHGDNHDGDHEGH